MKITNKICVILFLIIIIISILYFYINKKNNNININNKFDTKDNFDNLNITTMNDLKAQVNPVADLSNSQQVLNIIRQVRNHSDLKGLVEQSNTINTNIQNNLNTASNNIKTAISTMKDTYNSIAKKFDGYVVRNKITNPSLPPTATMHPKLLELDNTTITQSNTDYVVYDDIEDADPDLLNNVSSIDLDIVGDLGEPESEDTSAMELQVPGLKSNFENVSKESIARNQKLEKYANYNYNQLKEASIEPFEDWRTEWDEKIRATGLVVQPKERINGSSTNANIPLLIKYGNDFESIDTVNNRQVANILAFNVRNSTNRLLSKWRKNLNQ